MSSQITAVLASGAVGSILSVLFTYFMSYQKFKAKQEEEKRKSEISDADYYHKKWREDEDEIDNLRAKIRDLEDKEK